MGWLCISCGAVLAPSLPLTTTTCCASTSSISCSPLNLSSDRALTANLLQPKQILISSHTQDLFQYQMYILGTQVTCIYDLQYVIIQLEGHPFDILVRTQTCSHRNHGCSRFLLLLCKAPFFVRLRAKGTRLFMAKDASRDKRIPAQLGHVGNTHRGLP